MIQLTETAAKKISQLRSDENKNEDFLLRVKTSQGGCSGMSYKLDFDNPVNEKDKIFDVHGEKIVVDTVSYLYLIGMTLDYEGGLNGQGFIFSNPNATKTCGCCSSFAV